MPERAPAEASGAQGQGKRRPDRAGTEAALMHAALRLLRRDGVLSGLSLQDVADEAGVNRGLIHHYFGSRQALLRSALATQLSELSEKFGAHSLVMPSRPAKLHEGQSQLARTVMLLALDGDTSIEPIPDLDGTLEMIREDQRTGDVTAEIDAEAALVVWNSMLLGYFTLRQSLARQLSTTSKSLDARIFPILEALAESLSAEDDPGLPRLGRPFGQK